MASSIEAECKYRRASSRSNSQSAPTGPCLGAFGSYGSQIKIRSTSSTASSSSLRWYNAVVSGDSCAAIYCAISRRPAVINADFAKSVCVRHTGPEQESIRWIFQEGRALLANDEFESARSHFETAVSKGYRAARVDLASLLTNAATKKLDPARAVTLYEQAWRDGVAMAAFRLPCAGMAG